MNPRHAKGVLGLSTEAVDNYVENCQETAPEPYKTPLRGAGLKNKQLK